MKKIIFCFFLMLTMNACISTSTIDKNTQFKNGEKNTIDPKKRKRARELLLQADSAYAEKNWLVAKTLYVEAEELGAQDKQTLLRLGNLAIITQDLDSAQKYFTVLLSKEPSNSKAQYNLATVYLAQAENHFQYYMASLNDEPVEKKLFNLLQSIENFSNAKKTQEVVSTPLDNLRELLRDQ